MYDVFYWAIYMHNLIYNYQFPTGLPHLIWAYYIKMDVWTYKNSLSQVPENWMVEVVRSVYDLDNIKLMEINGPVHSEYELEYLLLEGHCFDSTSGAPPRGLQFTLGTKDTPIIVDTIVMANLGYFQLKANPGAWLLKLRHGKSEDIYDVTRYTFYWSDFSIRTLLATT